MSFFIPGQSINMENIIPASFWFRLEQSASRLAWARWKTSRLHINVTTNLWRYHCGLLILLIVPSCLLSRLGYLCRHSRCYKDIRVIIFFLRTDKLWSQLQNAFIWPMILMAKVWVSRHLLSFEFFANSFTMDPLQ